jgi:hypothetical protein
MRSMSPKRLSDGRDSGSVRNGKRCRCTLSGWEVCLPWRGGSARIGVVPQHQPAQLERLLALAQGYTESAMRNNGQVAPALLAD